MTRFAGASFQSGCYVYVDYEIASQNVAENYSDIIFSFGIHFGAFYFNSTNRINNWAAVVGSGSFNYSSPGSLPFPGGAGTNMDFLYYSSYVRIYHDNNGNAVMSTYAQINPSSAGGGGTRSVGPVSFGIPAIPRFPGKPSKPTLSNITSTSVSASFVDGVGGAPVDIRYLGWGTTNNPAANVIQISGNSGTITGLIPGTTYYVWAVTHNSAGQAPWSDPAIFTTLNVPGSPNGLNFTNVAQTSLVISASDPANDGGSPIIGYEIGYGTNPTTPSTTFSVSPTTLGLLVAPVTGLQPATTYYFFVKAQNAIGLSGWSGSAVVRTLAGSRVNVDGVWKDAIPYVKDGTWKLARPYSKELGIWKETI